MHDFYNQFLEYLEEEDKERAVDCVLSRLSQGQVDIVTLYSQVIGPALNNIPCHNDSKNLCIWREHTRSAIVRTILECCYPYVLKERNNSGYSRGGKVVVLCPDGEYHEIGARMVADFFTICGFQSTFVGASVPKEEFLEVIKTLDPDYIAISVTNYYNLVSAKRAIDRIRAIANSKVKIVVGGSAFVSNPKGYKEIGADLLLNTYQDIEKLAKGEI